jgi:Zn-dependent protease/CBS domain-containing protein
MKNFKLGSVFGIPIELDLSFLIVLPVFAWIIGSRISQRIAVLNRISGANLAAQPLETGFTPWIVGSVAAIGLFIGVVLHELGHSFTAHYYGYEIDSITLWLLGGISEFSEMPNDWRQEIAIAIAGPVVSVLLGVFSAMVFFSLPANSNALGFLFGYLGLINVGLAAFNMLPGFPLDGGRVFRAMLARNRPYARATQIAANVGKGFALLLGLVGLAGFNVILIGIAFFIYMGASSEAQQTVLRATLEGIDAQTVMTPAENVEEVAPNTSVATLMERMFREAHTGYPVVDDGNLVGLVTLDRVRQVEESEREDVIVDDIMMTDIPIVSADESIMDVFDKMQEKDRGMYVVPDDQGSLAGLVSRTDVMTAFAVAQSDESTDLEYLEGDRPNVGSTMKTGT